MITTTYSALTLLAMIQAQLDDLFNESGSGDIPNGEAHGAVIIAPGLKYS